MSVENVILEFLRDKQRRIEFLKQQIPPYVAAMKTYKEEKEAKEKEIQELEEVIDWAIKHSNLDLDKVKNGIS